MRPKLMLITSVFPPGGGGAAVVHYQLCKQFAAESCAVAPAARGAEVKRFDDPQPFPIFRVPLLAGRPLRAGPRWFRVLWHVLVVRLLFRLPLAAVLLFYLVRFRPEVVCIAGLPRLYWLLPLVRAVSRARVVFYIHGEEVSVPASEGRIARWFTRRARAALKRADVVVTVSRWTQQRVLAAGVAPEKVKVVYNGLDHSRFFPGPADDALREKHNLVGRRTVLTVARLDVRKGHETVLRALPAVLAQVPNLVYLIVGDGPQRAHLKGLVAELGLSAHVVFVPSATDAEIPAYYHTCDLFVQPNRHMPDGDDEGFGLVFLEAGACRKPVVGGRSGGVPEAVVDGETGILVDGASVPETARAIIRVLMDPELATRLAANGQEHARRFDWRATAAGFRAACALPEPRPAPRPDDPAARAPEGATT
jgi:phosphatidylinositol alpha-1,6-mannosyltransferase